jgi:polar amino acid transport system substrate-binding protein
MIKAKFITLSLLLVLSFTPLLAHGDDINIATGEFPPYTSESLANKGCVLSIVNHAFKAAGKNTNFEFVEWTENLELLKQGEVDASAYWMDRPDRRRDYVFPKYPVTSEIYRFVFRQDSKFVWTSFADLKGKVIAVNEGYTYTKEFQEALKNPGVETVFVSSEEMNLNYLLQDKVDLTIMSERVYPKFQQRLSAQDRNRLVVDTKVALINQGYLIFSRIDLLKSVQLADEFDAGYRKIRHMKALAPAFRTCGL